MFDSINYLLNILENIIWIQENGDLLLRSIDYYQVHFGDLDV